MPANGIVVRRIIDRFGHPVAGAAVEMAGTQLRTGLRHFGGAPKAGSVDVTDDRGEFSLPIDETMDAVAIKITARGFAPAALWIASDSSDPITLSRGATLTGRIVCNGQPVPHADTLLVPHGGQSTRIGPFGAETDDDGRFVFEHLPPEADFYLSAAIGSVGIGRVLPPRAVHVQRDDTATDLGDISVQRGLRVAGQIRTENGEPLPEGAAVRLSPERTSDSVTTQVAADGAFAFEGIPPGPITLRFVTKPMRFSPKNRSYDAAGGVLIGCVANDLTTLDLLVEKPEYKLPIKLGEMDHVSLARARPDSPLRGVEADR